MTLEQFLSGLKDDIRPKTGIEARIKQRVVSRINKESPLFADLHKGLTPKTKIRDTIWNSITKRIELPARDTITQLKDTLSPSEAFRLRLRARLLQSFTTLEQVDHRSLVPVTLKWVAALALFGLFVRVSPMFFIASPTVARTEALLLTTRGEVSVRIDGTWQSVSREFPVKAGMMLRTHDGEASIILHDDGVVRLAEKTTVRLDDLSDRLEPASEVFPSLTLYTGRIWMQGLVPPQLRGITVATSFGNITVNEGSVSIAEDDYVDVEVYDRSVAVQHNGEQIFLTSGERTRLSEDNVLLVKKVPSKWYQRDWANQNLVRDAVHRHDIVQLQHERRIAQAGILPSSRLYPVKRFAEIMDVFLTFDEQASIEKQLLVAETRLNEAAALIYDGQEASLALAEYTDILEKIAAGQNHGSLAEFLVQRALAESTSQVSAALPGDESYAIKRTVLETSVHLSEGLAREEDAQGALLLDGLAVMMKAVDEGRTDLVSALWSDMQPYLLAFEDENLSLQPIIYKEAQTLLSFLATSLHVASTRGAYIDPELLDDIALYLPAPSDTSVVVLTEEEVMQIVMSIRSKIFLYNMTQSRINQFIAEMKALNNHPDQGRILRRLALSLPEGPENFPQRVYKEIVKLRWENAAQEVI